MHTYQDLVAIGQNEAERMEFVNACIRLHKQSKDYKKAVTADSYAKKKNVTIMNYQKLLYTVSGKVVPDNFSSNYKLRSGFFYRFVTQENQFLLGNGISWNNKDAVEKKLGVDFDSQVKKMGWNALVHGVSFGFFDVGKLNVFSLLEFVPLYDEENGSLRAGIRFWQIDDKKPLRATLYEEDGYTDYMWKSGEKIILKEKRPYVLVMKKSVADGVEIYDSYNYPSFPIIPMWANEAKQSKLEGLREQIDAYDLIKSGFANDLDDVSQIFWTITNAGGMDDLDLATFVERMKTLHAYVASEDAKAEAHTVDIPYASREALLERLRRDLYEDAMAVDTKSIVGGANTATQILASYEPLNEEADSFEYCVLEFINGVLALADIEGEKASFTRSYIINKTEEIQAVIQASTYLEEDYVTEKLLTILGDADRIQEVLANKDLNNFNRLNGNPFNNNQNGV